MIGDSRAESNRFGLGVVQVIDREIEVNLLGALVVGPRGRTVIVNSYRREPRSFSPDRDEIIARECDLTVKDRGPESGEAHRVITIQRYRAQSCHDHSAMLSPQCRGARTRSAAAIADERSPSDRETTPLTGRRALQCRGVDIQPGAGVRYDQPMSPEEVAELARLRRARDLVDRQYAGDVDVAAMAREALMSPAHFSRKFRAAYGETPYSYIMTRRIERAKALLRQGRSVTDACVSVGCASLGSFSARFADVVGEPPSRYRERDHRALESLPSCISMAWTRPRRSASASLR